MSDPRPISLLSSPQASCILRQRSWDLQSVDAVWLEINSPALFCTRLGHMSGQEEASAAISVWWGQVAGSNYWDHLDRNHGFRSLYHLESVKAMASDATRIGMGCSLDFPVTCWLGQRSQYFFSRTHGYTLNRYCSSSLAHRKAQKIQSAGKKPQKDLSRSGKSTMTGTNIDHKLYFLSWYWFATCADWSSFTTKEGPLQSLAYCRLLSDTLRFPIQVSCKTVSTSAQAKTVFWPRCWKFVVWDSFMVISVRWEIMEVADELEEMASHTLVPRYAVERPSRASVLTFCTLWRQIARDHVEHVLLLCSLKHAMVYRQRRNM